MPVRVKICGINTPAAADAVLSAGADFAGLVFFPRSPRAVTVELGATLAAGLRGKAKIVALTVNASDDALQVVVSAVQPDFIQLHGAEDAARIRSIRETFHIPVIKAVSVSDPADFVRAKPLIDAMTAEDWLLFDARPPRNAVLPGGNGIAFDWAMLEGRVFPCPWLLAGGLSASNVAEAVTRSGAKAVDVSSGVECAPGVKDPGKIAAFVTAARKIEDERLV